MDGSQYASNVVLGTSTATATASSYPGSPAISLHHLQQQQHPNVGQAAHNGQGPVHTTLPPLQPQNPTMNIYSSHPHTPRTTPSTPNPSTPSSMSNYPQHQQASSQSAGRGYPQMMNSPYPPGSQSYTASSPMMAQTTTTASHPQPIAPAPVSRAPPPVLRPMPAGGVMGQPGLQSPYSQSPMMHQQGVIPDSEQPTHVVGSQGRRGILPSAPGRPAAPTGGSAGKSAIIPQKDADGKFPCPHCTKTYLHAKHLKRHLLRHTGDRPYMCVLCRDTFSRSDILKRHFQKCSIRRGNPTGASHLSHPQAHVKKHQAAQQKAAQEGGDLGQHMNGMGNMQTGDTGNVVHPFGMVPLTDGMPNMANDQNQLPQNQLSRSSSLSRMDENGNNNGNRDRAASAAGNSAAAAAAVYASAGGNVAGNVPGPMGSNMTPQMGNYPMGSPAQGQNGSAAAAAAAAAAGMPMFSGGNNSSNQDLGWQMFQAGAQQHTPTYVHAFPPNHLGQTQTAIPQDRHLDDIDSRPLFNMSNWGAPSITNDMMQRLSNQILTFFHPFSKDDSQAPTLSLLFSSVNLQHFLNRYAHFHAHFSFLHIPTFRIFDAYTGLIATICCIGACYSDRITPGHVRAVTDLLKLALERDVIGPNIVKAEPGDYSRSDIAFEGLQALNLLMVLLTWNGTPAQRESGRRLFPSIANLARRQDLLRASTDPSTYSVLHQSHANFDNIQPQDFDWIYWVKQERRARAIHCAYCIDTFLSLFFNVSPQFDWFEVHVPLPADDAAWEAQTPSECAEALHLCGTEAMKRRNPDGSQRTKQPELDLAVSALFHESYQIHPGSTNLMGKFVLVHALLAQIRRAQAEGTLITPGGQAGLGSANGSADNSGRATPVPGMSPAASNQTGHAIARALDKFKSNWDMDMASQFSSQTRGPRRFGYSRDGVHYFWLAKWLLKNGKPSDLMLPPDDRFFTVMNVLKAVRSWVMSDEANRGLELGSIGEIDRDYGATDSVLTMTDLFRPLPQHMSGAPVVTIKAE